MTIQDILSDLGMSSGAFYHYFDSKPAVLEALIGRLQQEAEQSLLAIVHDPYLSALDKLQRFFNSLEQSSTTNSAFIADLLRVWFADDNAIVREKVYEAMNERRAPLLTLIVRQGIEEGVFTTRYPDQAGEIILSLARGMGSAIAKLILAFDSERDGARTINDIVATYAAYADALESVLGAPSAYFRRPDAKAVTTLVTTLRGG
jgi:AcrR family transcriptional regulator